MTYILRGSLWLICGDETAMMDIDRQSQSSIAIIPSEMTVGRTQAAIGVGSALSIYIEN